MRRIDWLEVALVIAIGIPVTIATLVFFLGGLISTLLGFGPPVD